MDKPDAASVLFIAVVYAQSILSVAVRDISCPIISNFPNMLKLDPFLQY